MDNIRKIYKRREDWVMSYHPFTEEGHKCPKCGARFICTMEDGSCDNQGACDNCIRQAEYDRLNRWDYDPDHDD